VIDTFQTETAHLEIMSARDSQPCARPFRRSISTDIYIHYQMGKDGLLWLSLDGCRDREDDLRARHEAIFELANLGLAGGWITDRNLIDLWLGRHGDPAGSCRKLGCEVSGPLDAVARWIKWIRATKGI